MKRVAVVGVGMMGRNHVRVYSEMPEVELVGIVDQNLAVAEPLSHTYRIPLFTDVREMMEKARPDAVSIAVPTEFHYQITRTLLEMGCNVLIEKPIAATLEQAFELRDLASRQGCVLTVGHIERFNPAIIDMKRRLESGELGRVFQMHARRVGPFPTRIQDVGVIKDLAIHDLDIMQYLSGTYVDRVYAEAKSTLHQRGEDMFIGTLHFADDTIGLLEINWLTPTKIRELYVTGERGMYQVNYITQDLRFFENADYGPSEWSSLSLLRGVSEGSIIQYAIKKKEPLRNELETFIGHLEGKANRIVSSADAISALRVALALSESAKLSQIIPVNNHEGYRIPTPAGEKTRLATGAVNLSPQPGTQASD